MKAKDLLDIMGEIDAGFIADAAGSGEGSPFIRRITRYGAVAAAIGIVSFSVYAICGVIRDGVLQNQPDAPGYSSAADSGSAAATLAPQDPQRETETTCKTLPTDLFVLETLPVTTTVTTEKSLPFPADQEMPDNSLEQEIGDRFRLNNNTIVRSGVMAVSVLKAECFDTLEEAGLTDDDLIRSYRENWYMSSGNISRKISNEEEECWYTRKEKRWNEWNSYPVVQAHPEDYRFVLLTVKAENLNAVSGLLWWNDCRMPADLSRYEPFDRRNDREDDWFNPFGDDFIMDPNFARDYDFDFTLNTSFSIHKADERQGRFYYAYPAYFSLSGQEYDDDCRSEWFYLEPGNAVTFKLGAFMPRTLTAEMLMNDDFRDESKWDPKYPRLGEDLKEYYYFGSGGISFPHVNLHFSE